MQLFFVVGGVGFVHLLLDLLTTSANSSFVAFGNDGGGVFVDGDATGCAQHLQLGVLELETSVFGNQLTIRQHSHVFEHGLTTVTKTRCLHSSHVQHTAQTVHHKGGKGFFLNVLSNDQKRFSGASDLLEHRNEVLDQTNFLIGEQNVGLVQDGFHPLGVGGEIRGDIALIEPHTFGDLELSLHGLAFFERDHTLLADFVHSVGNHFADFFVITG